MEGHTFTSENGRHEYHSIDEVNDSYVHLMKSIKEKLQKDSCSPSNWSIYKVPEQFRKLNSDAYEPRMLSIGPFHHGKEKLLPMEIHKTRYMELLLRRTEDPKAILADCARLLLSMEQRSRNCYSEAKFCFEEGKSSTTLSEILLIDGCFMLELFLKYTIGNSMEVNDPIFSSAWMISTIQRDMALLENQIPFFIVEFLFEQIVKRIPQRPQFSLTEYAFTFFHSALSMEKEEISKKRSMGGAHLLDLIRNFYLPEFPMMEPRCKETWEFTYPVTKLREAGIHFRRRASKNLFDIRFSDGVIEIPRLYLHDRTDSLFRNLIAFEQCSHGSSHLITSYAIFMDRLIDSPRDVEFLEQERIIANYLGRAEDACHLFNNMCKEVVVKDYFFAAMCEQIDAYYTSWWPRNKAVMNRDYCSNPCRFISFLAASLLLILTMFQTGYSIASYHGSLLSCVYPLQSGIQAGFFQLSHSIKQQYVTVTTFLF